MSSRIFAAIIIISAILFFVPNWILSSPEIRQQIQFSAQKALDAKIDLSSTSWEWFPFPHICFSDVSVTREDFILKAPWLELYPDWGSIVLGKFGLEGVALEDPDLLLVSLENKEKKTRPPLEWIRVINGRFRLSQQLKFEFLPLKNKRPHLSNIYGKIEIHDHELVGKVSGNTSVASRVSISFSCDLSTMVFHVDSDIDQLDMARLYYKDVTTRAQFPAKGFLDVHLKAKGRAMDHVTGTLEAASACLFSKSKRAEAAFSCGSLKLAFSYGPEGLSLDIRQLDFAQPMMKLKGSIEFRRQGPGKHLLVDLVGRDIDLAQVRKSALILFKGHKEVKEVCNIVRGGQATRLSFHFDDKPSHLESLHCMVIKADLSGVPVYVPDQDLFIDSVSGHVDIVNAVLHLENASVRLRNTTGSNGIFVFGIADHNHEMELDIDVDADLQDVKWALKKFVHEDKLQNELEQVTETRGRVKARLMMGDDSRHFDTFVDVTSIDVGFFYRRLGWMIRLRHGSLSYQDDTLSWQGLSGQAGPHRIGLFSGLFSWKGRDKLAIQEFSGSVDAASFLETWKQIPALQRIREKTGLSARGRVRIEKFRGRTFLDDVSTARYTLGFRPEALQIESALLPGTLVLKTGAFFLDDSSFRGRRCQARLAGQDFKGYFHMKHHALGDWRGRLRLSGLVNHDIANWVDSHGWVPEEYFPKVPLYLQDFAIQLAGRHHDHVSGSLIWKQPSVSAYLDIDKEGSRLDIREIRVDAQGQTGIFRLFFDEGSKKRFRLEWKGELTASILTRCLRDNNLLKDSLSGDLSIDYLSEAGKGFQTVKGNLYASGLIWSWGVERPFTIQDLDINVKEHNALVRTTFQFFQDTITADGDITLLKNKATAYVDFYGKRLSDASLQLLIDEGSGRSPSGVKKGLTPGLDKGGLESWNLDIGGELSFGFDSVEVDLNPRLDLAGKRQEPRYVYVEGVDGYARFEAGRFTDIQIFGHSLCGLRLRSSITVDENGREERSLFLSTGKTERLQFADFLKCLGVKQHLLTGPFSAEMRLFSPDGIMSGSGSLKLHATGGNIRKFGLLSRILGVVNLVDLFSVQPGKGLFEGGFPYDEIILNSRITKGIIGLEQAVVRGRGLNLYGTGEIDIPKRRLDLIVFVAPLKTVDKIITSVPIIGAIIGGKHRSLITVPVKVSGPWTDPEIRTMPAKAVADVFKKLLFNVLKAPFSIFSRMGLESSEKSGSK